jgi:RND family efflux transporter MFP subunit
VAIPERDAPLANAGDPATITLQALPGQVFEGTVSRTAGVLAESSRTLMLEIDLDNSDGTLLPGMFGQATIVLDSPAERLTLPASTVRFDEAGNSYVYVVNASSEIDVVSVQTGLDDGNQIEITAGLDGAERIVGPLLRRLKAGQKVTTEG